MGILRSPFHLTAQIDLLNETLNQQRQQLQQQPPPSTPSDGSEIRLGATPQVEEAPADPEAQGTAGAAGAQRWNPR